MKIIDDIVKIAFRKIYYMASGKINQGKISKTCGCPHASLSSKSFH